MRKVFLSHAARDAAAAERLEDELTGRGFRVHRSSGERITATARCALAESSALVAVCSRQFSRGRARQWELTRAVLAAPDRVVAFNPEPDDGHIVPVRRLDVRTDRIADAVEEMPEGVFAQCGTFDERLSENRIPVDFRRLWTVHTALRGSSYVLTGPAGAGKTRLAEEYCLFFGDQYPGGIVWTGLAGERRPAYLAAAFAETGDSLGLDLHGLGLEATVQALVKALPGDALWVLDGATADLLPRGARALITMRDKTILPRMALPAPPARATVSPPALLRASQAARTVLAFAAVLGPAPITADLLVPGVEDLLGPRAPLLVAEALDELAASRLLRPAGIGDRPAWLLPGNVATALRNDLAPSTRDKLTRCATRVLRRTLTGGGASVRTHALELGGELIPALAAHFEERGDTAAARETWRAAGEDLAAARNAAPADAIRLAAPVIQRARGARDTRTEFRARLVAAAAYDERGDLRRADKIFHDHPLIAAQGAEPVWLTETERRDVRLARVRALRLRGRRREARELLDSVLPGSRCASPDVRGPWATAALEDAHLHLLAHDFAYAAKTAGRLVTLLTRAGRSADRRAGEAVVVLTEGEHCAEPARHALREAAKTFGAADPITLELRIVVGRILCDDGDIPDAVDILGRAIAETSRALGSAHPLTLRARQSAALAVLACGSHERAAAMFEALLPDQEDTLGPGHPECAQTRLELGLCLVRANRGRAARPLLKDAVKALHRQDAPWPSWVGVARAAVAMAELPGPFARWLSRERPPPPVAQPGAHPMP